MRSKRDPNQSKNVLSLADGFKVSSYVYRRRLEIDRPESLIRVRMENEVGQRQRQRCSLCFELMKAESILFVIMRIVVNN